MAMTKSYGKDRGRVLVPIEFLIKHPISTFNYHIEVCITEQNPIPILV